MHLARLLLNFCSSVFYIVVGLYLILLLYAVYGRISHGTPIDWRQLRFPGGPIVWILVSVISIAGLINITLESALSSTEIGSFYELPEYYEDYEATLFVYEKPIFCIASVCKEDSSYTAYNLLLPYGSSVEIEGLYDPELGCFHLELGEHYHYCKLEIGVPATSTSFELLSHITVSDSGDFCGSRISKTYHLLDCPHVKSISPENFIYFESDAEADVLGYLFCLDCLNRY